MLPSLLNACYEKEAIRLLRQLLKPGMTFVDVGANVGLYSAVGSKSVGDAGKVYSFEPEPHNFATLNRSLAYNGIITAVTETVAVGIEKSTLNLDVEKNSIGTHSLVRRSGAIESEIQVRVMRLDDFFRNIPGRVDLLKIDVEGYEPFVLQGARKLLERVDCLFFEYNRVDVEASVGIGGLIKLLKSFTYMDGIDEVKRTTAGFTISDFHSTNYIDLIAAKRRIVS